MVQLNFLADRYAGSAQNGSLAAALGMALDTSTNAPPIRASRLLIFKPQPVTGEEKKADKKAAMAR